MSNYLCCDCNLNAESHRGIIYVRKKINDEWKNVPQCEACWLKRH